MSLCKHCVSGFVHEGKPAGEFTKVDGNELYITKPSGDYPKDKAVILLTDVFGIRNIPNGCLLADTFAQNGVQCYAPDLFRGNALSADALNPGSNLDLMKWIGENPPQEAVKIVQSLISKLKSEGVTNIAAVGTCYGAKPAFLLAKEFKVIAVAHPSLLEIPSDLEKIGQSGVPTLFVTCETDPQFPKEAQAKADELLGDKDTYKRTYHAGQTHGFLVRGPEESKPAREQGFKEIYEWISAKL